METIDPVVMRRIEKAIHLEKAFVERTRDGRLSPPFSPPSGSVQWLFQEPPAKSKF